VILGKAMLYWGCSLKSQIFGQRVAETMCGPCGDRTAKTLPNTANANGEEFLHVEYTFGYCTPNLWFNSQHDSHTIICDLLTQYINRYVFTSCYHMFLYFFGSWVWNKYQSNNTTWIRIHVGRLRYPRRHPPRKRVGSPQMPTIRGLSKNPKLNQTWHFYSFLGNIPMAPKSHVFRACQRLRNRATRSLVWKTTSPLWHCFGKSKFGDICGGFLE
jgi:hypothetical protein